jgi:hypothetical protein
MNGSMDVDESATISRLVISAPKATTKGAQRYSYVAVIFAVVRLLQARVFLKMFDVGSGSGVGFFESLHGAVAIFAAHNLVAFCKRLVKCAWEPASTHIHLALGHHRRFLLSRHYALRCLPRVVRILFSCLLNLVFYLIAP